MFFLVLNPCFSYILKAGSAHNVKGYDQNICARVGQEPDILIDLLSCCVTDPKNISSGSSQEGKEYLKILKCPLVHPYIKVQLSKGQKTMGKTFEKVYFQRKAEFETFETSFGSLDCGLSVDMN